MGSSAQELNRSRRRLAAVASCVMHAGALVALAATAPAWTAATIAPPPWERPETPAPPVPAPPRQPVEVDVVGMPRATLPAVRLEGAAGGRPQARVARGRSRPAARFAEAAAIAAAPTPLAAQAAPVEERDEAAVELAATAGAEPVAAAPDLDAQPAAGGAGLGPAAAGPGSGAGEEGEGAEGRLRRDLRARVIGDPAAAQRQREGQPSFISNKEATALRTRDSFPRLPEAWWQRRGPYVVTLDICVSAEGAVTDAVLRSSEAPTLDAIVRDAVTTWRYRPRLVAGAPTAFCHGVIIKYERW